MCSISELEPYLEDAPWPATKDELIDFAVDSNAPGKVIEFLEDLEEDENQDEYSWEYKVYESIEDLFPKKDMVSIVFKRYWKGFLK